MGAVSVSQQTRIRHPRFPWWQVHIVSEERFSNNVDNVAGKRTYRWVRIRDMKTVPETGVFSWKESDGAFKEIVFTHKVDIERIEIEAPLPAPPPLTGQEWTSEYGSARVIGVSRFARADMIDTDENDILPYPHHVYIDDVWPPPGASLTDGRGHPWASNVAGWVFWDAGKAEEPE